MQYSFFLFICLKVSLECGYERIKIWHDHYDHFLAFANRASVWEPWIQDLRAQTAKQNVDLLANSTGLGH